MKINLNNIFLAVLMLSVPAHAQRVRWVMGTLCEIDAPGAAPEAVSAAFTEIERWDHILSLYREESELSVLNAAAGTGPVRVSSDLYAAVATALRLARESGGAFDPTILPILRRGPEALPLVGWRKVRLDANARTIELPAVGMGLDFGGIGKGWALDRATEVLRARGVDRALINFGGQILALGAPEGAQGWPMRVPGRPEPLIVRDASVAVSADSERPGHIFSPFNGRPVRRGSSIVLAPSATEADAWSTALFVLGTSQKEAINEALRVRRVVRVFRPGSGG